MPDLDKVERRMPPSWRPAYKLTKGRQPVEEVAKAVLSCLTRWFRESGGLPAFQTFAGIVQRRDAGLLDERSLAAVASRLDHQMESRNGKLLAAALLSPAVSGLSSILRGPPHERLAQEGLVRIINNVLFSQQRDYLVGKRFASRRAALEFETQLMDLLRPQLGELARSLVKDPSAERLRAPSLPLAKRRSTRDLLDQPL